MEIKFRTPRHRREVASIPASARWRNLTHCDFHTGRTGAGRPAVVAPRVHVVAVHAAAEGLDIVEEELVRARDFSLIEHASEDEAALVEVCARGGAVEFIDVDEERRFRGGGRDFGAKAPVAPSCSTRELCLSARVASNFSERYRLCTAAETCWRSSALVRASRTSAIITSAISSAHLGWVQRAVPAYQAAIAAIAARRSRHGNGYCR